MITIHKMHQVYIFRVCSVVFLVVQCHRFCYVVHFVCLLYLIYLLEGEGAGGGVCAYCTLLPSLCV